MIDYYKILQIDSGASDEVIKAAYRALVKKYHPDNYKGDGETAKEAMVIINEAYNILSDSERRAKFDREFAAYSKQEKKECKNNQVEKEYEKKECEKKSAKSDTILKKGSGIFQNIFKALCSEVEHSIEKNEKEFTNAYYQGLSIDEYSLIDKYKKSSGMKRMGYQKAMIEKEILYKNYEGNYAISYKYKDYFK